MFEVYIYSREYSVVTNGDVWWLHSPRNPSTNDSPDRDTSRLRPVTNQHTCVTCLMTSLRGRHRLHGRDTESGAGHRSVKCMYVAINPGEMRDSGSRPRLMDEPALRLVSPVTRHLYSDDRDAPRRTELGGSSRVHAGRLWTPSNLKR